MAIQMMANDSIDPTSDRNRLQLVARQPRERRSTHSRHRMGKGGTEFAVYQTKDSVVFPSGFQLRSTPAT